MIIKQYILGPVETNCWLLCDEKEKKAAVIDPGDECKQAAEFLLKEGYELCYVINTHGHFDHIEGNSFFKTSTGNKAQVAIHKLDLPLIKVGGGASLFGIKTNISPDPTIDFSEKTEITFGNITLQVIHTPGHTQGHVSLYHKESGSLFCGDVLFFRNIGRTDLPGGDYKQLIKSIQEKLFVLPDETEVYSGHGPKTTIGDEKKYNPYTSQGE